MKILKKSKAFTLIEMLLVVAIIVVITSVVLANNSRFGGTVLLQSLAYDIALTARQAQVYGTAVKRFQTTNFSAPYGVHFEISSPTTYLVFADALGASNGLYACPTPGSTNCELVQSSTIGRGFQIGSLCVQPNSGAMDCSITQLDVVYKRPEPDAYIRANGLSTIYARGVVVLVSPRGDTIGVYLESNGQISVRAAP